MSDPTLLGDAAASGDPDSPIRVVVTPSQSAYFAGETLSVRITFTNTNARTTTGGGAIPRSASKSHKRASYSVSSAPLAKPPTSPAGLYKPRTPTTAAPASPTPNAPDGTPMRRRGLIGKGKGKHKSSSVDLVEQRREKMLTKSLSLTIDGKTLKEEVRSAPHAQRSFTADAYLPPTSPRVSSPLARSETLPLPSKHPHARKQSVMDGTQFPYLNGNEASTSPTSSSTLSTVATLTSPTSGPPTPSASASTSSFSLVLDPIAEVSPIASTYSYLSPTASASAGGLIGSALHSPSIAIEAPSPPSASLEVEKPSYAPPSSSQASSKFSNRQIKTNRPPNIGLGKPPFLDLSREKNNTELILYSYAQMKGTVTLTPLPPNNLPTPSSAKSLKSPHTPAPSSLSSMSPSASISSPHLSPTPTPALVPEAQLSLRKVQALSALRYALLKGSATAVGGGSMDITSRTHSRTPSASRVGGGGLGGGLGSGSWSSLSIPNSAGTVSAYGPSLGTIHSGSTEGPVSPSISRRPSRAHSRASSFSSGLLSIFGSPFGLGGSGPVSAPVNLPASVSAPNVSNPNIGGEVPRRPGGLSTRNRTVSASAGLLPSSSSGWPGYDSGPGSAPFDQSFTGPASAALEPPPSSSSVTSFSPSPSSRSGLGLGLGLGWPLVGGSGSVEDIDPDVPLPTFEVPSAVLAVDAELEPGESRSYEYSILLPSNLPPTFRGRTFRFEYELVVGICRSAADGSNRPVGNIGSGVGPMGSMSKVMKVPIRVYTNVVVGKLPTPYDLLWPVTKRRSLHALGHRRGGRMASNSNAKEKDDPYTGKVVELTPGATENSRDSKRDFRMHDSSSLSGAAQASSGSGTIAELKEYAKRLVAEFPELPEVLGSGAEVSESPSSTTSESFSSSISVAASTPASSISKPSLSPLVEEDSGSGEESMEKVNGYGNGNAVTPAPASTTRTFPISAAELAFKEKERVAKLNLRQREREESDEPIAIGGCGEAVEILTRIPKKVSYDVNKDGVKVAVLTFIKSAFRLGETIHGVVELNERIGRARVVQLSAHLETHESLPYAISTTPNTPSAVRQLKRVHVEHHSSFALSTLRTTFALDIPSDASPAFQIKVGEDSSFASEFGSSVKPKLEGGLEWKVRLCLLVAVAKETSDAGTEGVRFKSLIRDGPRGEWGSAWKAPVNMAPSEKPVVSSSSPQVSNNKSFQPQQQGIVKSWTSFIAASLLGAAEGGYHDGSEFADEDDEFDENDAERPKPTSSYDGIKPNRAGGVGVGVNYGGGRESSWQEVKLETVECEVPLRVWPGNTAFKPVDVVFDV